MHVQPPAALPRLRVKGFEIAPNAAVRTERLPVISLAVQEVSEGRQLVVSGKEKTRARPEPYRGSAFRWRLVCWRSSRRLLGSPPQNRASASSCNRTSRPSRSSRSSARPPCRRIGDRTPRKSRTSAKTPCSSSPVSWSHPESLYPTTTMTSTANSNPAKAHPPAARPAPEPPRRTTRAERKVPPAFSSTPSSSDCHANFHRLEAPRAARVGSPRVLFE